MDNTTRNPRLLLKLSGMFLLRMAARTFLRLLFHEPPVSVRPAASILLHFFEPATQKTPHLIHHADGVFVLPETQ